ncbi:MAG: hypothetical protein Q8K63_10705 [Acidimicrobiales bacterium]|nr:hypothetical protein [Acidimicrobiales bacterium]
MTDAPSGPPVALLTRAERRRRRRMVAIAVTVVSLFAVLLTVVALNVATKPNADVQLGSSTFKVGRAATLARRIKADDYPLLFQDLRNQSLDIYLQHVGKTHLTGWRAIEAHAPDAPRTCQLEWNGDEFRDPCDGTTYAADGAGLRQYQVNVVDGVVFVNFRVER